MAVVYTDERLAEVVAESTTLREVAVKLGARPAPGTLSHLRRRIFRAGIDVRHFPGLNRRSVALQFSRQQLVAAAERSTSVRGAARYLGVPDDGRSRAALRRLLTEQGVDVSHFSHRRADLCDTAVARAVPHSNSYAEVLRRLGLPADDVGRRRLQRRVSVLGLDTTHFTRRSRPVPRPGPRRDPTTVLRRLAPDAPRVNRERLKGALDALGVAYRCAGCGNEGEWRGRSVTLHIDHIDGDWRNNGRENLRYLCPNCHAITDTWCRKGPRHE
ncbi:HNH endonuclease [Streptomyces sp. TR06-5]|uniref:HNH endonuclease n=1 Tax=Streptomyces sp. TR06-5 TaxID=3385976 RepID=UPI00399F638D